MQFSLDKLMKQLVSTILRPYLLDQVMNQLINTSIIFNWFDKFAVMCGSLILKYMSRNTESIFSFEECLQMLSSSSWSIQNLSAICIYNSISVHNIELRRPASLADFRMNESNSNELPRNQRVGMKNSKVKLISTSSLKNLNSLNSQGIRMNWIDELFKHGAIRILSWMLLHKKQIIRRQVALIFQSILNYESNSLHELWASFIEQGLVHLMEYIIQGIHGESSLVKYSFPEESIRNLCLNIMNFIIQLLEKYEHMRSRLISSMIYSNNSNLRFNVFIGLIQLSNRFPNIQRYDKFIISLRIYFIMFHSNRYIWNSSLGLKTSRTNNMLLEDGIVLTYLIEQIYKTEEFIIYLQILRIFNEKQLINISKSDIKNEINKTSIISSYQYDDCIEVIVKDGDNFNKMTCPSFEIIALNSHTLADLIISSKVSILVYIYSYHNTMSERINIFIYRLPVIILQ